MTTQHLVVSIGWDDQSAVAGWYAEIRTQSGALVAHSEQVCGPDLDDFGPDEEAEVRAEIARWIDSVGL